MESYNIQCEDYIYATYIELDVDLFYNLLSCFVTWFHFPSLNVFSDVVIV